MHKSKFLPKRPPDAMDAHQFATPYLWLTRVRLPENFKSFGLPVFVGVAYYLGAQAAFYIGTLSDRIFAPFWPPNIVLFCTLLLVPKRQWWLYIAATFPAHVLAESGVGMPAPQLLVAFVTNCTLAISNAFGVRWFLGEPPWFGTVWNALIYILITAVAGPAVSGLGGAFVQVLGGGPVANYWTFWSSWSIANALGSVTLGPVFLLWFSQRSRRATPSRRRKAEAVMLALILGVACAIAFRVEVGTVATGFLPALLYSPLPLILWAAIRFGQAGASGAILMVTVVSIWQNLHASTVFIGLDPQRNVLALQLFLMGIAIPVFLLGAAIDELRRTGDGMRELAGTLLRAQDEERRRIARELHDSTGQNLVVAGLIVSRIQSMAPASCGPVIDELNDVLRRSIMEIRTVSYLLHPPFLDGNGLDMALRSYLEGFSKRTGIDVELDLSPDLGRMPSFIELVLFRVVQEGLSNVWRHSGSATARVHIARETSVAGPQLTLSIEDSGKGFPKNVRSKTRHHIPEGLGLASMRERLRQIGGRLEIDSISGRTIVRAVVRLDPAKNQDTT